MFFPSIHWHFWKIKCIVLHASGPFGVWERSTDSMRFPLYNSPFFAGAEADAL